MALAPAAVAMLSVTSSIIGTGASIFAQNQANKAGAKEAQYRESLLSRKADAEKNTLRENSRRRLLDRDRRLAELRVRQAAGGFANSGTQLAIFGEIHSRMDDDINIATDQGLDQLASYSAQISMSRFATGQRKAANQINQFSTLLGGATKASERYHDNYQQSGQDPFNIYR